MNAREALFTQMWNEGQPVKLIRSRLGLGSDNYVKMRERLGLPARHTVHKWEPEVRAEMERLWLSGVSASEVARLTPGATRSGVIGLMHRRGIKRGRASRPEKAVRAPRATTPRKAKPRVDRGPKTVSVKVVGVEGLEKHRAALHASGAAIAAAMAASPIPDDAIRLVDRRRSQCAWPLGQPDRPANQMCCGRVVPAEQNASVESYCNGHARRAVSSHCPRKSGEQYVKAMSRFS